MSHAPGGWSLPASVVVLTLDPDSFVDGGVSAPQVGVMLDWGVDGCIRGFVDG
jgi:hypothetical protein